MAASGGNGGGGLWAGLTSAVKDGVKEFSQNAISEVTQSVKEGTQTVKELRLRDATPSTARAATGSPSGDANKAKGAANGAARKASAAKAKTLKRKAIAACEDGDNCGERADGDDRH